MIGRLPCTMVWAWYHRWQTDINASGCNSAATGLDTKATSCTSAAKSFDASSTSCEWILNHRLRHPYHLFGNLHLCRCHRSINPYWVPYQNDTHKSRSVNKFVRVCSEWSEVKWSEMKWSEKWSEVKSEVKWIEVSERVSEWVRELCLSFAFALLLLCFCFAFALWKI